jgi:regulator of protease activity HflC (stomatin/prohibitin superfamily)
MVDESGMERNGAQLDPLPTPLAAPAPRAAGRGAEDETRLTQEIVSLDDAAAVFMNRDASGRIPIIIIPRRPNRIVNALVANAALILAAGIAGGLALGNAGIVLAAVVAGTVLLFLGVFRAFLVRIPEGSVALLTRGGRYVGTVGAGLHILLPWVLVSHLVTRREIPYEVPPVEAPTQETVRVRIDALLTFAITDAYRFVYRISADDFDHVLRAAAQDVLRSLVRRLSVDGVMGLSQQEAETVRAALQEEVARFGAAVTRVNITFARPPAAFLQTQEGRNLAVLQRAEQAERQTLALRRLADEEALALNRVTARLQRELAEVQGRVLQAAARRELVEAEASAEALRLARLADRLERFPQAASFDLRRLRLDVARSLAGNTRAVVQLGEVGDVARTVLMRDTLRESLRELGAGDDDGAAPDGEGAGGGPDGGPAGGAAAGPARGAVVDQSGESGVRS